MKASTDPESTRPHHYRLPKHLPFLAVALVAVATVTIFILAPDANNVLGSSWSPPEGGGASVCSYAIRRGDNLFRIGMRFGVPYQYLALVNGIVDPSAILAGTILSVPCGPASQPAHAPEACGPSQSYVVNPGDNLFRIALNHGSSVNLIRDANGLWGRVLRPGMKLTIPCPGSVNYGGAPPPPPPVTEAPETGAPSVPTTTPTATRTRTVQAVTPQITPQSLATAIPVNTAGPARAITPALATPINPAAVPQLAASPTPVIVNMTVRMRGSQFSPDTVQIPVGGRVTFLNDETDGTKHTVTCAQCPATFTFDSGNNPIDSGKSFSVLFNVLGVYFYDSKLQPQMTGMIIVTP